MTSTDVWEKLARASARAAIATEEFAATIQAHTIKRVVRRDAFGVALGCESPGCYQAALEPDGRCDRHSVYLRTPTA